MYFSQTQNVSPLFEWLSIHVLICKRKYMPLVVKKIKYSVHDANLTWKIAECDSGFVLYVIKVLFQNAMFWYCNV